MDTSEFVDDFLEHYGVKGMKWGVRKNRSGSSRAPKAGTGKGWTIHKDGMIEIEKGAILSRVVRQHSGLFGGTGVALDSGAPIYAAFKSNDIAGYEHFFGRHKSLLVRNASLVLKLSANNKLKAPGPKESTSIYYNTLKKNPELLANFKSEMPFMSRKALDRALEDPSSQKSYETYAMLLDSANFSKKEAVTEVNARYFHEVKKSGYNMLLDPSDAMMEFDAPVMVLDGGKNLTVSSQHIVDKVSAEKARRAYKSETSKQGQRYLESLGYFVE